MGQMTTIVLQSGMKWGRTPAQPDRGGGAPPTPPPRFDFISPDPNDWPWALAFHGTFDHTLDAKNRLTVPSKFRSALAGKVFLVKGADRCLSVYPEDTYTAMTSAALAGLNPLSAQARELSRFFYANAMEVELDGAGRIMLPARFMEHAGIGSREVVVAGRRSVPGAVGSRHLGVLRRRPRAARA